MKTLSFYKAGFNVSSRSFPMIFLIYLYYLIISLLLAIPFYSIFKSTGGNSLLPGELLKGFDATALREILAAGGQSFLFYVKAFLPWLTVFLLIQVFLTGGMFAWLSNPRGKFSIRDFHTKASCNFLRFLKLTLWMLLIHALLVVMIYLPWFLVLEGMENVIDKKMIGSFKLMLSVHCFVLVFLMMVSDLAKSRLYEQDSGKALKSIWLSFKLVIRRFFGIYTLSLLLLIIPVIFFAVFYLFRSSITAGNMGIVIVVFFAQQFFIFARILFRVWRLSSSYGCYIGYGQKT